MTAPILTVVIPTYNRPNHLKNLVRLLLPQQNTRWKLVIVDNYSDIPARELVPSPDVHIVRNPANIGAAGNFPRCFEIMDTDWVWMIGDDDLVDDNAIERVLVAIDQYPDAAILNFGCHGLTDSRETIQIFSGFSEFLTGCDSISISIWMSGNVYSRRHYWPYLGLAFRFANSQSSHYVLLMMALISGGTFVQLPNAVCRQAVGNLDAGGSHSELMCSIMALADLPMPPKNRRTFARRLQRELLKFFRDLMQCTFQMQQSGRDAREEIVHLFLARWVNWAVVRSAPWILVQASIGRLLLGLLPGRLLLLAINRLKEAMTGRRTVRRPYVPRLFRAT